MLVFVVTHQLIDQLKRLITQSPGLLGLNWLLILMRKQNQHTLQLSGTRSKTTALESGEVGVKILASVLIYALYQEQSVSMELAVPDVLRVGQDEGSESIHLLSAVSLQPVQWDM